MSDEPHSHLEPEVRSIPAFQPDDDPGVSVPLVPHAPRRRLAVILFLLTCASTVFAGTGQFPAPRTVIDPATGKRVDLVEIDPATRRMKTLIDWRQSLVNGLTYATAVMLMLGAHEMGHYLQARRYGVPASLPLFIPMPFGALGTMGAVIIQQAGTADRKSICSTSPSPARWPVSRSPCRSTGGASSIRQSERCRRTRQAGPIR
jgi:hypothetical protein